MGRTHGDRARPRLRPAIRIIGSGAAGVWWPIRSSKPAGPCSPRVGRFDSFAAPPSRRGTGPILRNDRTVPEPVVVARTVTPEGHEIVLLALRWAKIIEGHPEMAEHLDAILQTVSQPDYREPDLVAGRERMFRRGGAERWMRVVIDT